MAKILVLTDFAAEGSGYQYLMSQLLSGLAKLGHDIKVAGINYQGGPHSYPFSVLPARTAEDAAGICHNMNLLWNPDVFIVGMDIPFQQVTFQALPPLQSKYIAITPLENGPLRQSWASVLAGMKQVYFISELGKQEALKVGLQNVEHLRVGVDSELWHIPTEEERKTLRTGMGIAEDEFVIFCNSENQERKNLSAAFEIVSKLKKSMPDRKFKFILLSHIKSFVGWDLQDLSVYYDIVKEYMPMERGLSTKNLWGLYSIADVFLHTTKAEGLGMPILEAMGCGVPVVATDTGALHEHLKDGRGLLIKSAFQFIDVWGNSRRDMIDVDSAVNMIKALAQQPKIRSDKDVVFYTEPARGYIESRTWDAPVQMVHQKIEEIVNEQKK